VAARLQTVSAGESAHLQELKHADPVPEPSLDLATIPSHDAQARSNVSFVASRACDRTASSNHAWLQLSLLVQGAGFAGARDLPLRPSSLRCGRPPLASAPVAYRTRSPSLWCRSHVQ